MKKNKKLYIACMCFIILIVSTLITRTMQNDTYFTIATGNQIIENGYDNLDHLSWHEDLNFYKLRWIFDIVIATIYNNFSFEGIYIFVLIIASITGITLFNILLKQKTKIIVAFVITLFAMICTIDIWGFAARAQIISYLLLLLEVFVIEKLIENKKSIYYICLFGISVLIMNFHASVWMMSIILILPYLAEAIFNKLKSKKESSKIIVRDISIKSILIAITAIVIGSLISPIGIYAYTYMFKVVGGVSSKFIGELQITNIVENAGILIVLTIFIIMVLGTKTKIRLSDLIMFSGLTIMAIMAIRNIEYLYIIGSIVIARIITEFLNKYDNENLMDKAATMLQKNNIFIVVILIVMINSIASYIGGLKQPYIDETNYPVGAVDYIKKHIDYEKLKVFNHFNFGSYMEFCGIPAFVDSRSEIYTE